MPGSQDLNRVKKGNFQFNRKSFFVSRFRKLILLIEELTEIGMSTDLLILSISIYSLNPGLFFCAIVSYFFAESILLVALYAYALFSYDKFNVGSMEIALFE